MKIFCFPLFLRIFPPTRVKNNIEFNRKRIGFEYRRGRGSFMKKLIGLLFVLLLAMALGASLSSYRMEGVSMVSVGGWL